jgi:3-methyl-2-oxobutanoate hydroxymethyltransferase
MALHEIVRRVTTHVLHEMKLKGEKIAMLTAYDYSMARILDQAGIDIILVGDSASNVMAGHETTLPITLDQMINHAASVVRAVKRALVVCDLPFGTYQGNSKEALTSAIRIMKETGAHAVKLEGGREVQESVSRILSAGIPVMGHLGLMPQSIHKFGTYVVRARDQAEAQKLVEDAHILEDTGCFGIVLEKIRHARDHPGVQSPFPAPLPQPLRRDQGSRRELHRGCADPAVPQRKRTILRRAWVWV